MITFQGEILKGYNLFQKRFILNEFFSTMQPVACIKSRLLKNNTNKTAHSFSQNGFNISGIDAFPLFRSYPEKQRQKC
jgi:hypothetical protein